MSEYTQQNALIAFAKWVLDTTAHGCSLDGDDVTQKAEMLGLVERDEVTEPCNEGCACSDHGFPTICYRFTDLLTAAPEQKPIKLSDRLPVEDELRRDAERYRWLKKHGHLDIWLSAGFSHLPKSEAIDADIDEAAVEALARAGE